MALPKNIDNRPVAVIGAGVLGQRISLMLSARGGVVHLSDPVSPEALDKAKAYIDANLEDHVATFNETKGGGFSAGEVKYFNDNNEAARGAWLVIEAVPEVVDIKNDTYEGLKDALDDDAVLATNSSSYASSTFVDHVKDPTRFLNLHFAMPPVQNFIEIMGSGQTDQELFDFMLEHMSTYGLQVVPVYKESTGFAINRVWAAIKREVLTVLGEGVSDPEAIDAAFKELTQGTVGPVEMMDRVGLDTVRNIERHYNDELPWTPDAPLELLDKMVDDGKLGLKSGEGFYRWENGQPQK